MDRYFIPEGYRQNAATTLDTDERVYWSGKRILAARTYQRGVYVWADALIRSDRLRTVADVGCGFAHKLYWLYRRNPEIDFWGIDQASAIRLCRQHYGFGQGLELDLGGPVRSEGEFDLVISSDVIEHLEDPDLLLDYIKAISGPDGYVLLSTPERDRLRGERCLHSPNAAHVREWNYGEFERYLTDRGFDILEHRLLPAQSFSLTFSYLRKVLDRAVQGRSMRYSQAVLARVR